MKLLSFRIFLIGLCLIVRFNIGLAQSQNEGTSYVVQANDWLSKLADKYYGNPLAYTTIVEGTNAKAGEDSRFTVIDNPDLIDVGQKIWIPATAGTVTLSPTAIPPTVAPPTSDSQATAVPPTNAFQPTVTPPQRSTSPTGHIAFSFWNKEAGRCTYEINIVNVPACLQGGEQCQASRRIFSLNSVSEPALSSDGTRLAFRGWGGPLSDESPYLNCAPAHPYRHLGHSTLDGTNFIGTGGFWEDSHPDWSPDGNRLIYDSDRHQDGVTHLQMINMDGNNEQNLLIAGQHPSWGPDNFHFVYRGCDLNGNRCGLWQGAAIPVKTWERGSNMVGPIIQASDVAHPDWSPSRDEIVYQRLENQNWNVWAVNVDGTNDRALVNSPNLEGLPSWSPDGNWIAYLFYDGQNWQIRIVSRDGQDDRHIFTYDGGQYVVPSVPQPYGVRDWIDEQISWSN